MSDLKCLFTDSGGGCKLSETLFSLGHTPCKLTSNDAVCEDYVDETMVFNVYTINDTYAVKLAGELPYASEVSAPLSVNGLAPAAASVVFLRKLSPLLRRFTGVAVRSLTVYIPDFDNHDQYEVFIDLVHRGLRDRGFTTEVNNTSELVVSW